MSRIVLMTLAGLLMVVGCSQEPNSQVERQEKTAADVEVTTAPMSNSRLAPECRLERYIREEGMTRKQGMAFSALVGLESAEYDISINKALDRHFVPGYDNECAVGYVGE